MVTLAVPDKEGGVLYVQRLGEGVDYRDCLSFPLGYTHL